MFVVYAAKTNEYYTGKAGSQGTESSWVASDRAQAFTYELPNGAQNRANMLNKASGIHKKIFEVISL